MLSFVASTLWIAGFSYIMVWMVSTGSKGGGGRCTEKQMFREVDDRLYWRATVPFFLFHTQMMCSLKAYLEKGIANEAIKAVWYVALVHPTYLSL